MEFAPLERRPESANPQLSQGLAPQSSSETPMLPENRIDYSQIPPAFQRSFSLGELPTSPPERMQGQPDGVAPATAPTLLAQSIALPAAAGAGAGATGGVGTAGAGAGVLGVIGAGAALIWGGPLAQPTGDATLSGDHAQRMRRQQVLKSQRGRQGKVGDSEIEGEAHELIAQAKAQGKELEMKDALAQLMKKARQSNNGKGDSAREAKIRATQKAETVRGSRQSKDGKKKPPKGEGKKGDKNDKGNKGNN
jgi:hypothetical protein